MKISYKYSIILFSQLLCLKQSSAGSLLRVQHYKIQNQAQYQPINPTTHCHLYSEDNQSGFQVKMYDNLSFDNLAEINMNAIHQTESQSEIQFNSISENFNTFDRKTSSIYVKKGCTLFLYSEINFSGKRVVFYADPEEDFKVNLIDNDIRKNVRSAKCTCSWRHFE